MMIKDETMIVNSKDTGEGKWSKHPELMKHVAFTKTDNSPFLYTAKVNNKLWKIRLNDFPDEPLYTVYIDEEPIMSFNNWPDAIWKITQK